MNPGKDIRAEIVGMRKKLVGEEGFGQGLDIPARREVPVVPFPTNRVLICEIKRSSPSKGSIGAINDPVSQAGLYINGGADVISILTEKQYFNGSLNDLINIKNKYPEQAVLRKDFLFIFDAGF